MKAEKISSYKDLIVWQKSMDLVVFIYRVTRLLPDDERFNLISQMRRCSVSIPSNIAEGGRRRTRRDTARFLNIAFASGAELETQLELCIRLDFIDSKNYEEIQSLITEIMKMLNRMLINLNAFQNS